MPLPSKGENIEKEKKKIGRKGKKGERGRGKDEKLRRIDPFPNPLPIQ